MDNQLVSGVLVVDKPAGMTSAHVVARVKRNLGVKKVGHTGTLDPLATGVLPLCLGEATKIAGYLSADDKAYEVEFCLGIETDTLDADGTVVSERPVEATREMVADALAAKVGQSEQVPPMFSAIKQGGRRLHELARQGKTVDRAARRILIYEAALLGFAPPLARARVSCSKGTYIRSLVADIGTALGCGAHVTKLRRTKAGSFDITEAIALADIDPARARAALISPAAAVANLLAVKISDDRVIAARHGQPLRWQDLSAAPPPAPEAPFRLLSPSGALVAMCTVAPGGRVHYRRVLRAC